jgi:serine/threonine protein kinase
MFILNEKEDKIVDYYAFRRRVSTLEDIMMNPTSPYVIERAVFLSIQLFASLHSLNLFHGDIKPSNVMFGDSG